MYCMYLRKSRADLEAEARGEGETLRRHKEILLELAKRMKIIISKIYEEVVSGETIVSRPVMQQLLTDVESGMWDGVLVVEVERLARGDTMDQGLVAQTFKFSGTKIITPMKTYDPNNEFDEEYFEFGLFMSRREYKTTNRRLQAGRLKSVKEGKFVGNIAPYGYIRKKIENDKGYTLEIHPEQAPIVKLVFEWYTKGILREDGTYERLGVSLIANRLNELKIPPMRGDIWVPATLQDMLQNPVYIGKIRWNNRPQKKKMVNGKIIKTRPRAKQDEVTLVNGLHPPIIDEETFYLTQEIYGTNFPGAAKEDKEDEEEKKSEQTENQNFDQESDDYLISRFHYKKSIQNPLAGLIVCGVCGRKMKRRPHGDKYPPTLMCPITGCDNVSTKLSIVEDKLIEALGIWLENYKIDISKAETNTSSQELQEDVIKKTIEKLDNEINTIERQMDNLHDLLEQGVYSIEVFIERSKKLKEKLDKIQNDKNDLLKSLEQTKKLEKSKKILIPKIEKVIESYHKLDSPAKKNALLRTVLEKAIYTKKQGARWHGEEDDFELLLFPKIPK